jgi:hypothetical protein
MKRIYWIAFIGFAVACAHGKLGKVDQALEKGAITKSQTIYIETISAKEIEFTGDKAADVKRTNEERAAIEELYSRKIALALRAKGFDAKPVTAPVKAGIVISGRVTRFEHGSGAARALVGWGAGSSNLYTNFKIEDRSQAKLLSKFEVIATSGGQGGLANTGSFMEKHLADGAEKVVDYIVKAN